MTKINMTALDMEPEIEKMLTAALALRHQKPYTVRKLVEVEKALSSFMKTTDLVAPKVSGLKRLGGGASKEQFVFELDAKDQKQLRCVLRMDPLESAVVTSRQREFAILKTMKGIVPVPQALWADYDGSILGCPAIITDFIDGVTKPSKSTSNVSGLGTEFDTATRKGLSAPFIMHLVAMHSVDWRAVKQPYFQAPINDPQQAARWQLNWWTTVWANDSVEGFPLMGLAERWMRDNLPNAETNDLVFVHSDYRTGNYLYDEATNEISSILDWELIHIGDFHEDLAWAAIKSWSTMEEGVLLASGLMSLENLCGEYTKLSGRQVDRETLYFYQVLGLYKCVVICLATSVNAAQHAHNHQDALMSWLATAGYVFLNDLHELLEKGAAK